MAQGDYVLFFLSRMYLKMEKRDGCTNFHPLFAVKNFWVRVQRSTAGDTIIVKILLLLKYYRYTPII